MRRTTPSAGGGGARRFLARSERLEPPEEEPPAGCDFSAVAGDWAGTATQEGFGDYGAALTIEPSGDIDEPIANAVYTFEWNGEELSCGTEWICLGRMQNDWHVTESRVTVNPDLCEGSYALFRLAEDGSLDVECAARSSARPTRRVS